MDEPSENLVRKIPFPEHPLLPTLDVGDRVREDPERIVWRDDGDAEHVPQGDEHKQMLQVHAGPERGRHVTVGGHPIDDALHPLPNLAPPALLGLLRIGHLVPTSSSSFGMRREANSLALRGDYFSAVPPSAAATSARGPARLVR